MQRGLGRGGHLLSTRMAVADCDSAIWQEKVLSSPLGWGARMP